MDKVNQPSLFDVPAAIEARDEALERVEQNASKVWTALALATVLDIANNKAEFTTDDVWEALNQLGAEDPHESRAIGAVMRNAAKDGLIRPTDRYLPSQRVACHRRPVRVWHSCTFQN